MKLKLDGHEVFAASGGRGFDTARPLVIFLHGAGMDSSVWALQSRWFAHHGWNAAPVDLPGHGRSGGKPLTSIGALADWVAHLVGALGADKAALVGHSLGALVALEAAARHAGKVRSLGLIGVAAAMPVHADLLAAARHDSHDAIDMVALWGYGFAASLGGSPAPGLWMLGAGLRLLEKSRPGVLFDDLSACNDYTGGLEAAARVACPTVLILGQRDLMAPPAAGRALGAAITGARPVVVQGAGHMLMAERPDAVLEALAEML